ncbi:MAG: biopolymer transporter ExbD [Acidobacteriota bacterium]
MIGRRRRREPPRIEISSLVDIVFLLLIFFMVTTRFAEEPVIDIELSTAEGESQAPEQDPKTLQIDSASKVYFLGKEISLDEVEEKLTTSLEGLEGAARTVRVEIDRDSKWQVISRVIDDCRRVGAQALTVPTDPDRGQ